MKSIACLHVWWPNLDREIENCAKKCIWLIKKFLKTTKITTTPKDPEC